MKLQSICICSFKIWLLIFLHQLFEGNIVDTNKTKPKVTNMLKPAFAECVIWDVTNGRGKIFQSRCQAFQARSMVVRSSGKRYWWERFSF